MNKNDEDDFDLFWGIAPEESLKFKRGEAVKDFINELLQRVPCCGHECCCRKIKEEGESLLRGFAKR